MPFLNLFKLSEPWLTQCDAYQDPNCSTFVEAGGSSWNTREQAKLILDSNGYPRSLPDPAQGAASGTNYTSVATLVPTGLNSATPAGRFIVLYDGEGTLAYGRGASRNASLSSPGRDVIDVSTDGIQTWIQVSIKATDPNKTGNHIRNLRLLQAGGVCSNDPAAYCDPSAAQSGCASGGSCRSFEQVYPTQPFDPRFLRNLAGFKAVRFMAFQNTNDSQVELWADRTLPDDVTWVSERGDGGPVEMAVALGNQLGADIWVNMPTHADDGYVRSFATLVKNTLAASRKVYVEYSNEAWNGAFSAGSWMENQALTRWAGASDTPFGKRLQWYGMRTAQICDIWKAVWGASFSRVVCVLGAQAANPWTARQALDCPLWAAENGGASCVQHGIRALAIAPYFGYYLGLPENRTVVDAWTGQADGGLASLFAELLQGGSFVNGPAGGALEDARRQMLQYKAVAAEYGLELVAYEGGQHLAGVGAVVDDNAVTDLFVAANRDGRMGPVYSRHLNDWSAAGGGLYNLWNSVEPYSKWGAWGLLEYRDQGGAPKYDAVKSLLSP
ncbi:hypothetical protein [Methylococcus capsulatus]|uniref:hypothetical protein n=1 Tax=Methylococcus capsulatus TaxID=414 RepID=UPI000308B86A|nr:hypothetical protein [Methylococcus capsulatus]